MKKLIGAAVAVAMLVFSGAAHAQCDLYLGFDVFISGRSIDDGFFTSSFTSDVLFLDICTTPSGLTTDYFEGYLYDQFFDYWKVSGTIIWNPAFTLGYIQGANVDVTTPYIDGTIKYSRGFYSISARGGNSDGASFIEVYTAIKGRGAVLAGKEQAKGTQRSPSDKRLAPEKAPPRRVSPFPAQASR